MISAAPKKGWWTEIGGLLRSPSVRPLPRPTDVPASPPPADPSARTSLDRATVLELAAVPGWHLSPMDAQQCLRLAHQYGIHLVPAPGSVLSALAADGLLEDIKHDWGTSYRIAGQSEPRKAP